MKHLKYIIWIWLVVLCAACEPMVDPNAQVILEQQTVVILDKNSAALKVVFNSTAATIQSVVVCYSTNSDMSNAEECAMKDEGNMTYRVALTNLRSNTTYYVRYKVSNAISACIVAAPPLTTKNSTVNGYEYVDLGLSVKWATCNVGATKPEEYGDYFAWGETAPKEVYDWRTYKWCSGSYYTLTKYCTSSSYGTVDNKETLDLSDDAARANWGGNWRMPTRAEQDELRQKCTWTWITQNGVYGYRVTSNSNGNSIFLPAAGYRRSSLLDAGSYGDYWSSSLSTDSPVSAYHLFFYSSGVGWDNNNRYYGQSVRPVYGAQGEQLTAPMVVTGAVTQIAETTAVVGGNVTSDGGASVTERGVVYSTSSNPTTANSKVASGSGTGAFTCNLTNLQPNTTYYVRAYASNDAGIAYGEQVSFTTKEEVIATPAYVDLGLSVKWATFNVGATKPEEYGDYFAWGETEPKSTYDWSTYSEASDDVAAVKWGGSWRMPTQTEQDELRTQCTWTWTTQNGVKGYRVTGTNGNSIFLPAAGYRSGSSLYNTNSKGFYWSRSLYSGSANYAYYVSFTSYDVSRYSNDRCYGQSVRPVCP